MAASPLNLPYTRRDLQKPRNGNTGGLHLNEHVCQRSREDFGFRFTTIVHGSLMFSFKKSPFGTLEFQMPRGIRVSRLSATSFKILVANT